MDGIALKPLTVSFSEPGFVAKLNQENQLGPWFTLSDQEKQQLGSPMGPQNPQALNRYSYVLNNPMKYTDPTGHWVFTIGFSIRIAGYVSFSYSAGVVLASDGSSGIYESKGHGPAFGAGGGIGVADSIYPELTNAKDIEGAGQQVGLDHDIGGADLLTDPSGKITGYSGSAGFGFLEDIHGEKTFTTVKVIDKAPTGPITANGPNPVAHSP